MQSYLVPAAAIIAAAGIIGLWAAPGRQRKGRWLGKPVSQSITWIGSYQEAFQRVLDCCSVSGLTLINADPARGEVVAAGAASLLSGGTTFRALLRTELDQTSIELHFAAAACLFDWGDSHRKLTDYLTCWGELPLPVMSSR